MKYGHRYIIVKVLIKERYCIFCDMGLVKLSHYIGISM